MQQIVDFIQHEFGTKEFIPLHAPVFSGKEAQYVQETLQSTMVSSVGQFVDDFEKTLANYTQSEKAVAVVNGTSGLQVALQLVGVAMNDEVLTQALTFVATANAISYLKAHPVFLDVDRDTMGLSPNAVADFLDQFAEIRDNSCYNKKTGRRIAACVPMHTFGFPVRIHELVRLCEKWHIPIVEDAAESLGSFVAEKSTGSFGTIGVFSFNGNKIITAGGGGALVTSSKEIGEKAKYITTTAKVPHPYEYVHDELGYNFRMPNLNAALLLGQMEQLDYFLERKRLLAQRYADFFASTSMRFRKEIAGTTANYWLMCVETENKEQRDALLEQTNAQKVMTRPIWQLMYRLPMYQHCWRDAQINAEFLEARIVNIPSSVI